MGTSKENTQDKLANGGKTFREKILDKYGYEGARALSAKGKAGNTYGAANKGKPKSEEHKAKIAANRKGGRAKKIDNADVMK